LKLGDGIADVDFAWMARLIDPAKHCLGIVQMQ
jgi:hypothetical protein